MRIQRKDRRRLFLLIAALVSAFALVGMVGAQDTTPVPTLDPALEGMVEAAGGAAQTVSGAAGQIWAQLTQAPQSDLARILMIVGGIVLLVAGWYVYEWIILIAGFLIGGVAALALLNEPNALLGVVIFLIGGVIGAALGALLWYVAVFLTGGYVGIVVTQGLAAALNALPVSLVAIVVGFLIGGVILILLSVELLIVFSAIVGAQMIALALDLGFAWMVLLALAGMVVQLVAVRARGEDIRRRPLRRPLWARGGSVD